MKLVPAGALGLSAAAIAALAGAAPAVAAPDCGPVPAGATLTLLAGTTCQLDFAAAGSFSWTLPPGLHGLQALLVGAGGGAFVGGSGGTGYAGSGGDVRYVDYTAATPGATAAITVGAAGLTSATVASAGTASSTAIGGVTSAATGGTQGISTSWCEPEGAATLTGNGGSAAGDQPAGENFACETSYALGINPAASPTDSYGTAAPAIFADVTSTFGSGGRVLITADILAPVATIAATGQGADVHYVTPGTVPEWHTVGGSGRVILRYATTASSGLATTGVDAMPILGVAALTAGLGAVLLATSRRRMRA